eukprot:scaffold9085_cov215-Amphora_coffeaeformis.AAC.18
MDTVKVEVVTDQVFASEDTPKDNSQGTMQRHYSNDGTTIRCRYPRSRTMRVKANEVLAWYHVKRGIKTACPEV